MGLEIHEFRDVVLLRVSATFAEFVLRYTFSQVACGPDIDGRVRATGHDVGVKRHDPA